MRSAFLALIGFTTYTLCVGLCPMSSGSMSNMNTANDVVRMASSAMQHDSVACESCEDHSSEELALSSSISVADATSPSSAAVVFSDAILAFNSLDLTRSKAHLATTGPPVVPNIVKTIVLRT